jgi:serine/threonine protein kinase
MPSLLLLEYCENGTLGDHARTGDLTIVMMLQYCHDVASGMHYMSSRRIVHRDLAARNVLLDAGYTCKISDFGMSAALTGAEYHDADYASNYVRLHGDLPMRWAAVEVLNEGKYSRASVSRTHPPTHTHTHTHHTLTHTHTHAHTHTFTCEGVALLSMNNLYLQRLLSLSTDLNSLCITHSCSSLAGCLGVWRAGVGGPFAWQATVLGVCNSARGLCSSQVGSPTFVPCWVRG